MTLRGNIRYSQHYGNVRVAGPSVEVVLLEDLRTHARVVHKEDDEYLLKLIVEAREEIEDTSGLAFISQTWQMTMDRWPGHRNQWWDGVRELPVTELEGGFPSIIEPIRYPLISVDTINVFDEDSNSTAVTIASVFDIDVISKPGRVSLQRGATWPIASRSINSIEINYTAGYGTGVVDVPTPLTRAVRNMAGYLYDHRGSGCTPAAAYSESGAAATINRYRSARL